MAPKYTPKSWYEVDIDSAARILLMGDEWRNMSPETLKIDFANGFSFVDDEERTTIRGPITSIVAIEFEEE